MIGYDEALATILREAGRLDVRPCAPGQALGHVLAEAVTSGEDLPPFDNSSMDGFALRAEGDALRAGSEFDVGGAQAAGDPRVRAAAGAWEIMTGACLPEGLDAVVPVEQVEVLANAANGAAARIRLLNDVTPGQYVRLRGADVMRGTSVIPAGTRIAPQHLMLMAALGVRAVQVARRPRVAILTTGRELVDDPTRTLASGEIRNGNGPFLEARTAAGAEVVMRETVTDDAAVFLAALDRALGHGADVVVSTGAISMGRHDFIPAALHSIGANIHFHKVRIRPGKPLLFARLAGGQLYFGLPGNPVSSAVGLRFFVEPAIHAMTGLAPERPLRVPLAVEYRKRDPLRFHLKGRLEVDGAGCLKAHVLPGQESFRILPLVAANAWIVVPETVNVVNAAEMVDVYGLAHDEAPRVDGPVA